MIVWVIGAGGIGRVVAAYLSDLHGAGVRLVPQRRASVAPLSAGLTVTTPERTLQARPAVTALDDIASLEEHPDLALICVKGQDTDKALSAIESRLRADTALVTLQNGLHAYHIARRWGRARVLGAILAFDGKALGSAEAVQRRADRRIVVGGFTGVDAGHQALAAQALSACAPVSVTDDLPTALWGKLIANAAVNAASAITSEPVASVLASPEWLRRCVGLVAEGIRVAHALGIRPRDLLGIDPHRFTVSATPEDGLLTDFVAAHQAVATLRSSMCRDLDDRRTTEVGWINGEIVRQGRAAGVDTPLHRDIVETIRRLELARGIDPAPEPILAPQFTTRHHDKTKGSPC